MLTACTASGASSDEVIVLVPEPMCIATTVPVSAHAAKNGSQYPEWMLGEPQPRRQLGERDRLHPACRVAPHLGGRELDVPQRDQAQRDQAAVAARAPLVDLPVVVRLDAQPGELLVLRLEEDLPAEPRVVRERERRLDVVHGHVVEAGLRLPAPRAHLVEGDRRRSRSRRPGSRRRRSGASPSTAGPRRTTTRPGRPRCRAPRGSVPPSSTGVPGRRHHDVRADVAVLRGQALGPHVGRFDDVVVEAHDPGDVGHRGVSPAMVVRCSERSWPAVSPTTACCTQRLSQMRRSPGSHR